MTNRPPQTEIFSVCVGLKDYPELRNLLFFLQRFGISFARSASERLPLEIHGEAPQIRGFGSNWGEKILEACCDPHRITRLAAASFGLARVLLT